VALPKDGAGLVLKREGQGEIPGPFLEGGRPERLLLDRVPMLGEGRGPTYFCPPKSGGALRGPGVLGGTGWVHAPPPPLAAPPNFL
jgi:hypothetical protein